MLSDSKPGNRFDVPGKGREKEKVRHVLEPKLQLFGQDVFERKV
jgi:hypothetical protein